ncbi:MAG: quinol monooxygenase YgiN [Natronomonas sp.]|jgi:quinol monooxygenase YgiN|uniref:putative quinol monooxygenase n=1 Tax=Natronomonas sp. TaxID=2184060 RepID=UPI00398964DD
MIVVHATFPLDSAKREEALELIKDLVEQSQAEAGTIDYRAVTDVSEPNVLRFVERCEDTDAFETHIETEHFQAFEAALPELLAEDPETLRFEVESATELELRQEASYGVPASVRPTGRYKKRSLTMVRTKAHV